MTMYDFETDVRLIQFWQKYMLKAADRMDRADYLNCRKNMQYAVHRASRQLTKLSITQEKLWGVEECYYASGDY